VDLHRAKFGTKDLKAQYFQAIKLRNSCAANYSADTKLVDSPCLDYQILDQFYGRDEIKFIVKMPTFFVALHITALLGNFLTQIVPAIRNLSKMSSDKHLVNMHRSKRYILQN